MVFEMSSSKNGIFLNHSANVRFTILPKSAKTKEEEEEENKKIFKALAKNGSFLLFLRDINGWSSLWVILAWLKPPPQ